MLHYLYTGVFGTHVFEGTTALSVEDFKNSPECCVADEHGEKLKEKCLAWLYAKGELHIVHVNRMSG